jgi:hypothetical protein
MWASSSNSSAASRSASLSSCNALVVVDVPPFFEWVSNVPLSPEI